MDERLYNLVLLPLPQPQQLLLILIITIIKAVITRRIIFFSFVVFLLTEAGTDCPSGYRPSAR
jgi:hypothetical protein